MSRWAILGVRIDSQLGLEASPQEYVSRMVMVFREVRRVLRADGTLWLNVGDSYAGGGNNRGNNSPLFAKHPAYVKIANQRTAQRGLTI